MSDRKTMFPGGEAWPNRRDRMTEVDAIVERMVEDLAAHRAGDGGRICDLTRFGWTPAQCQRFGAIARARFADASHPIHLVARHAAQPDIAPIPTSPTGQAA